MRQRIGFSYYPWITQHISPADLKAAITEFVDLLNAHLKSKQGDRFHIDPPQPHEVPQQMEYMQAPPQEDMAGKIGLLNPLGYALVYDRSRPALGAVAVVRRNDASGAVGPTYKAQLYRRSDSDIKSIRDMRGRTIAFGSPQSTSNFLVPAGLLHAEGLHPLTALSAIQFAGGHDTAAIAVYERRADVGAGHDGVISNLKGQKGFEDADKVLVNLAWSQPIPSDPVVVHASDPAVHQQVTKALLEIAPPNDRASAANAVVKRFWGTDEGFEAISPDAYAGLLELMHKFGLTLKDVMR